MVLILAGALLALLPLLMTTAFTHLMLVSVYSSAAFLGALAWAVLVITIIARRHRIAEWRIGRKHRQQLKKLNKY